jgi:limonene-1,2-epoxide hydrolase
MTTATQSPLEVVRKFMIEMEQGQYDSAMALISPDCDYVNPPPLGAVRGPGAIRGILEPFFAPTLENELKVLNEAVSGSVVFMERLDRHRLADKWVELPVTGVFEVKAGRIISWRDYFDAATLLTQWPVA